VLTPPLQKLQPFSKGWELVKLNINMQNMNYGVKFPAEYGGALGISKNPKFDHQILVFWFLNPIFTQQ